MNLSSRLRVLLGSKDGPTLDHPEDPGPVLDAAYEQQLALLRKVQLRLSELATARRQLEQQARELRPYLSALEALAERAPDAGVEEDTVQLALQRKQALVSELEAIDRQLAVMTEEERKLTVAEQQLSARVEEVRIQTTPVAASPTNAEEQVPGNQLLTGVSGDPGNGLSDGRETGDYGDEARVARVREREHEQGTVPASVLRSRKEGAMKIQEMPRSKFSTSPAEGEPRAGRHQMTLTEIEQVIEGIGARYVADLRLLSEEFGRFYESQLTAKDEQIADLTLRLEIAERERAALETRIGELKHTGQRYVTDLRTLSEELSRRVETAEREREALESRLQGAS